MKKIVTAMMVTAFVLSAGAVFAAKVTCTVESVTGDVVTMKCDNADKIKQGDKVNVKAAKKALEGC
jgi:ABC-type transporter Mla subunit MlaD